MWVTSYLEELFLHFLTLARKQMGSKCILTLDCLPLPCRYKRNAVWNKKKIQFFNYNSIYFRLAAINCLCAHTASHPQLTDKHSHIADPALETAVVNMMSCILPGVLAALQDVATCTNNPGHAIVVVSLFFFLRNI